MKKKTFQVKKEEVKLKTFNLILYGGRMWGQIQKRKKFKKWTLKN